jgi:hypothetical protein
LGGVDPRSPVAAKNRVGDRKLTAAVLVRLM